MKRGEYIRPGPESIAPRSAPGGVVVRFYEAERRNPKLLHEMSLPSMAHAIVTANDGTLNALELPPAVTLVCYDGDTGKRFVPFGMRGGERFEL